MPRSFEYPVAGVPRAFSMWVLTIGSFAMNVELDGGSGGTYSRLETRNRGNLEEGLRIAFKLSGG